MSALDRPTCGWLEKVLSIFATRTGWSSEAVLLVGTLSPVSGQNCGIDCPPITCCGLPDPADELDPPQAVSIRPVAVRADKDRARRRTRFSIRGCVSRDPQQCE